MQALGTNMKTIGTVVNRLAPANRCLAPTTLEESTPMERSTKLRAASSDEAVVEWGSCPEHGRYPKWVSDPKNPSGRPMLKYASCPVCEAERKHKAKFRRASIPSRFEGCTVNSYKAVNPGAEKAKSLIVEFCRQIGGHLNRGHSIILAGNYGTGKTHLACAVAKCALNEGYSAQFVTVRQMLRDIRETWKKDARESEADAIKRFTSVDLLVLDEVGAQTGSENEALLLFDVIGERYANMKSTILISNFPVSITDEERDDGGRTIGDYLGGRILDRFCELGSLVIPFTWKSYRGSRSEGSVA